MRSLKHFSEANIKTCKFQTKVTVLSSGCISIPAELHPGRHFRIRANCSKIAQTSQSEQSSSELPQHLSNQKHMFRSSESVLHFMNRSSNYNTCFQYPLDHLIPTSTHLYLPFRQFQLMLFIWILLVFILS